MTTEGEIIVVGDTADDFDEDTESGTDGTTAGESGRARTRCTTR
jgi:hypothetical protein